MKKKKSRTDMPMTPLTFFITRDLAAGLKALKDRDGMPVSEAIRRAVADFLRRKGIL